MKGFNFHLVRPRNSLLSVISGQCVALALKSCPCQTFPAERAIAVQRRPGLNSPSILLNLWQMLSDVVFVLVYGMSLSSPVNLSLLLCLGIDDNRQIHVDNAPNSVISHHCSIFTARQTKSIRGPWQHEHPVKGTMSVLQKFTWGIWKVESPGSFDSLSVVPLCECKRL